MAPKIIPPSLNLSQRVQDVTHCGGSSCAWPQRDFGRPTPSTGRSVWFWKTFELMERSRSHTSHQPEAYLSCAISLNRDPKRSLLQLWPWLTFWFTSAWWETWSICAWVLRNPLECQQELGTGAYVLCPRNERGVFHNLPSVKGKGIASVYWAYTW